eukprot:s2197_g2.t1
MSSGISGKKTRVNFRDFSSSLLTLRSFDFFFSTVARFLVSAVSTRVARPTYMSPHSDPSMKKIISSVDAGPLSISGLRDGFLSQAAFQSRAQIAQTFAKSVQTGRNFHGKSSPIHRVKKQER